MCYDRNSNNAQGVEMDRKYKIVFFVNDISDNKKCMKIMDWHQSIVQIKDEDIAGLGKKNIEIFIKEQFESAMNGIAKFVTLKGVDYAMGRSDSEPNAFEVSELPEVSHGN